MFSNQKSISGIVPNNCDEDIPEIYDEVRRGPLRIEDVPRSILERTEDYVIINKPWDVRMYGDFKVTVEKLVNSWIGVASGLKWVHRLDYATSGVLCVGLNTKFAAAASWSFEKRMVKKQYLAVLQGTVKAEQYSPLPNLHFQTSQHKRKRVEVQNQQLPTWQDQALQQGLQLHFTSIQNISPEFPNLDSVLKQELEALQKVTFDEYLGNNKLRKRLRKLLKNLGILENVVSEKSAFVDVVESSESFLPEGLKEERTQEAERNVVVWNGQNYTYRLSTDQLAYLDALSESKMEGNTLPTDLQSGQDGTGDMTNVLWNNAPIQDIAGDFRMRIADSEIEGEGRNCETKIEILEYGTYQGKPVTKVLLTPWSGRRHQLRLHCLSMGHPIVGDGTYGSLGEDDQSERMMLHALRISIRLKYKKVDGKVESETVDPFPFNDNNELSISKFDSSAHVCVSESESS